MKVRNEHIVIVFLTAALVMVSCLFYITIANDERNQNIEVVTKNSIGSTVEIICTMDVGPTESRGTGFITSYGGKNIVISNAHVILLNDEIFDNILSRFYNSSTEFTLNVISYNNDLDISILEFEDTEISTKPLKFGDSSKLRYSQEIITIGNALGYGLSVTNGIVSTPHIKINTSGEDRSFIQTNININRGNSGGPVLDINGNVIGMMSFRLSGIMGSIQGMSFAIPSNIIYEYIEDVYK
jgi:S1-C subfamily serine protease